MEATSLLNCSSKSHFSKFSLQRSSSPTLFFFKQFLTFTPTTTNTRHHHLQVSSCTSLPLHEPLPSSKDMMPKIDKSGRFCSPRAARELALYGFHNFLCFYIDMSNFDCITPLCVLNFVSFFWGKYWQIDSLCVLFRRVRPNSAFREADEY